MLNDLKPAPGSRKKSKRIGRGPGSGHGKTATKGHKGQRARSGGPKGPGFEGGQMPLQRRVGKRGFKSPFKKEYEIVNLDLIDKKFGEGEVVNPQTLREKGLINRNLDIKILSRGTLSKPLSIHAHKFSKGALDKIKNTGGSIKVISK